MDTSYCPCNWDRPNLYISNRWKAWSTDKFRIASKYIFLLEICKCFRTVYNETKSFQLKTIQQNKHFMSNYRSYICNSMLKMYTFRSYCEKLSKLYLMCQLLIVWWLLLLDNYRWLTFIRYKNTTRMRMLYQELKQTRSILSQEYENE